MINLPRLELTEDPTQKNDFIIFRKQLKGKKVPSFYKNDKQPKSKTKRRRKSGAFKKHKTIKHKSKSIFNLFT